MKRSEQFFAVSLCGLLFLSGGCESLQRKFTRKPKNPPPKQSPIIRFQDYSHSLTPLDRYQKHYLMFDYWNNELVDSLQTSRFSIKRVRRASNGAVSELRTLRELLQEEDAKKFQPLLKERESLDRDLNRAVSPAQVDTFRRRIENQTRAIHRDYSWSKVQDRLRSETAAPATH